MVAWWWILLSSLAFLAIGFLLGMKAVVSGFKKALTDEDSPIRKMLDQEATRDAETYAKGAEIYDAQSKCLLRCGHEIATMFRDTAQRMALKKGQ